MPEWISSCTSTQSSNSRRASIDWPTSTMMVAPPPDWVRPKPTPGRPVGTSPPSIRSAVEPRPDQHPLALEAPPVVRLRLHGALHPIDDRGPRRRREALEQGQPQHAFLV